MSLEDVTRSSAVQLATHLQMLPNEATSTSCSHCVGATRTA